MSDCLHIFRVFTSPKNASVWLQSNYVRRRNDNRDDGDTWSFWGVAPGYRGVKDPPTLLYWSKSDCFCIRFKGEPEFSDSETQKQLRGVTCRYFVSLCLCWVLIGFAVKNILSQRLLSRDQLTSSGWFSNSFIGRGPRKSSMNHNTAEM